MPQVPAWAEANKPRVLDFLALLDGELKDRRFVAGDRYTVADITGLVSIDFMKPAKLAVPETLGNLKRWHAEVSARPSAQGLTMRLTVIGSGDAFGSGGRFNTCFMVEAGERTHPARLRRVLAGRAQGAQRRSQCDRRRDAQPSARRPFRRAAVPAARLRSSISRRERPLTIAGPPGTRERLERGAARCSFRARAGTSGGFRSRSARSRPACPTKCWALR